MPKDTAVSSSSLLQLRRLQRHFVLFLLAIIIPVLGMIYLYQKHTEATLQTRIFAEIEANTQQKKLAFEQLIQIATTHLQRIGMQFTDALEKPELAINDTNWKKLRSFGVRSTGSGELVGANLDAWWRERLGALFVSPMAVADPLLTKELAASMAVFPAIRAAHQTYPYFQWTSYYSAREDFLAVYPYVSEEALQLATGSKSKDTILNEIFNALTKQVMQMIGPLNNPHHLQQWTAPYYDSGGHGAMVSLFLPQYMDKNFVGVLGTDVTLNMFDKVLQDKNRKLGHVLAVDRFGNLIADDIGQVQRNKAILILDNFLPDGLKPHLAVRSKAQNNVIQHTGSWYWISVALQGSEWELITYFSEQELKALEQSDAGNSTWIMLALLAALGIATWLISYYFALPSLKLVDFLVKLSSNPAQISPVVPKAWRPAFGRVATTSHERQVYLQELESQKENLEKTVILRTKEVVAQSELAEKARRDIELLSEMGREITASLDVHSIEKNLCQHVRRLIPGNRFCIGMLDWNRQKILFDFVFENDLAIPAYEYSLSEISQAAVKSVLGALEIIEPEPEAGAEAEAETESDIKVIDADKLNQLTPSGHILSAMYVPLILNEKVIGVISVQSEQANTYHQNDLVILRSLAAYATVAFDNAFTYQRLQQTQEKLVEQEKMAALGSIVAGVAHELNTPIGNSLLTATTLAEMTSQTMQDVDSGKIRRSTFQEYGANAKTACELMIHNLSTAANLIASFKQIAVDQTSDQRRVFNLSQVTHEVALTLDSRLRREERHLEILIDETIELDSFPGPYGQVISNLMMNALIHAFNHTQNATIKISSQKSENLKQIKLIFSDNGSGIEEQHLHHIFEPFYTTRMGQGGGGLGLHICYNIITAVMGGSIRVKSTLDTGTRFEIDLPLSAP